ncbi:PQQ_DH_like and PQQ_2 domain-containing protein [Ktedonobacteria bacterium brp13]|nr:PQQ_DH_like and PQQ_2 domain-containing protein [Ktedonobacteria bacterium brp13]
MDYRPDQNQQDQSDIEFEIIDIDVEESGDRSARLSGFDPLFTYLAHHARLWSALTIFAGCMIIGILLFPDIASFVKPMVPSSATATPMVNLYQINAYSGSNNVTLVTGDQDNGQCVSVTAYDTQSGVLLWSTPQSSLSTITYGEVTNIGSPDVSIYERRSDGLLSLLAPRTGKVLWHYKLPSAITFPSAYEQDGILFFSGSDNVFYAIKDGRLLWRNASLGDELQIENGVVYTYNSKQQRYSAINEESGARLWSYAVPGSTQSFSQTLLPLTIENNIVYVQTVDYKLLAIQPQGHILWTHQLNDAVNLYSDAHHLYAIDQAADALYAFNLLKGSIEQTYTNETGVIGIMDIQNNLLYIHTDEGVRVVNADTRKIVWQKATNVNQPMEIVNGTLYVCPLNGIGSLQAFDERDGTLRWSRTVNDPLISSNNSVFELWSPDNNTIAVLRLSDGKILWSKHIL